MSDQDRERGYYRVMAGRGSMHSEKFRAAERIRYCRENP